MLLFTLKWASASAQVVQLSGSTYRQRADAFVAQVAKQTFNANTFDVRYGFVYVAARYLLKTDTSYANRQINILLDRARSADNKNFTALAVMGTYMLCKSQLNETIRRKIRRFMESLDFSFPSGGTYNLTLMPHTAAYLACEEWPDFNDASTRSYDEIRSFSFNLLERFLVELYRTHAQEVDSPTYYPTNIAPIRMLADFAKDPTIQRKAFSCYQAMIAIMNGCYNDGLYVANPKRSKGWSNLGDGLKKASGLNSFAWLLFGKAEDRFYFEAFGEDRGYEGMNFWLAYPGYTQPNPAVLQANAEKTYPYFRLGRGFKRTFQSHNYGLATWDTPQNNPSTSYNWKETKRTYLAWQSNQTVCHFTINQENPRRPYEPDIANGFGYGDNPYHRVMQHNGTAVGIWNVPSDYTFYKLYNAFPKTAFTGLLQKNGWIVCHTGTMMFALKTLESYTWDVTSDKNFNLQWVDNRRGSWVLETTELVAPFNSGVVNTDLNRFADSLHKRTVFTPISYTSNTPRLQYKSLSGDVLDITYFRPEGDYTNQFKVNQQAYDPITAIVDDPFAYQNYQSNDLYIKSNGVTKAVINYNSSSTNTIKIAQPTPGVLNFSASQPSATYHWVFPEGTTFLNGTTPFSAFVQVKLPLNADPEAFQISLFVQDGKLSTSIYPAEAAFASNGLLRFNTDFGSFEGYFNGRWVQLGSTPLDQLSATPVAAYALRKLRSKHSGFAIKVRRSSDNMEKDIGFDASGKLDVVGLQSFVGSSDGFIRTWYDQSGNSRNAGTSTASSQPQIINDGNLMLLNGVPSLYPQTGGSRLDATNPEVRLDNIYISIVKARDGSTSGGTVDLGNASGFRFGALANTSIQWKNGGNTGPDLLKHYNPLAADTWGTYGFWSSSADETMKIFANHTLVEYAKRTVDTRTSTRLRLFTDPDGESDKGNIGEVIIFDSAINEADRKVLLGSQLSYYGITNQ